MTDAQLSPTAQKVLALLQQNRGTPYAADDICELADCSTGQAQLTLEALANAGQVERQQQGSGRTTYVAR
jgi:predicted ArsR family transcriptional regulator